MRVGGWGVGGEMGFNVQSTVSVISGRSTIHLITQLKVLISAFALPHCGSRNEGGAGGGGGGFIKLSMII